MPPLNPLLYRYVPPQYVPDEYVLSQVGASGALKPEIARLLTTAADQVQSQKANEARAALKRVAADLLKAAKKKKIVDQLVDEQNVAREAAPAPAHQAASQRWNKKSDDPRLLQVLVHGLTPSHSFLLQVLTPSLSRYLRILFPGARSMQSS